MCVSVHGYDVLCCVNVCVQLISLLVVGMRKYVVFVCQLKQ